MKKKKNNPAFFLTMPFGEALERFIGTNKKELDVLMDKGRAKKPPGRKKKTKRKPPEGISQSNVVRLRDRRKPK